MDVTASVFKVVSALVVSVKGDPSEGLADSLQLRVRLI
jgi:hypothetical protein